MKLCTAEMVRPATEWLLKEIRAGEPPIRLSSSLSRHFQSQFLRSLSQNIFQNLDGYLDFLSLQKKPHRSVSLSSFFDLHSCLGKIMWGRKVMFMNGVWFRLLEISPNCAMWRENGVTHTWKLWIGNDKSSCSCSLHSSKFEIGSRDWVFEVFIFLPPSDQIKGIF